MQPSRYQQAIYTYIADAIAQRRGSKPFRHLVVEAAAGSGKTHTLVEAARHNPSAQFVMIAFGKRNADELAARLPPNARASTAHSLGSRAWTETLGGRGWAPEVAVGGHSRPGKIARIVDAEVDKGRLPRWLRGKVEKLVDLARMHGIVPGSRNGQPGSARVNDVLPLCGLRDDTDDEWLMLMEHFDVYATGTVLSVENRTSDMLDGGSMGAWIADDLAGCDDPEAEVDILFYEKRPTQTFYTANPVRE